MGPTADRIMDAAFSCAQESPDVTMADVARAAGLSRQGVYLHFPDRKTLLIALALQAKEDHPGVKIEDAPSARAALHAVVARMAEIHPKIWPVVRALESETGERSALANFRPLAERFHREGALALHLSPQSSRRLAGHPALTFGVERSGARLRLGQRPLQKSHITFLAAGAHYPLISLCRLRAYTRHARAHPAA